MDISSLAQKMLEESWINRKTPLNFVLMEPELRNQSS